MVHIPLRLRLDGAALVSNWHWLAHRGGGAVCGAAVKADGYGLGAREAVKRLQDAGCRDFFVATWREAEALTPWPGDLDLSVLHGVLPGDMAVAVKGRARPVLNSPEQVTRWRETGLPCDVMVDTGMNRLGLTPQEARSGLLDGLRIQTLMSHLACADEPDHVMNERQLGLFRTLRQDIQAARYSLANSAGICLGPKYCFGLTRPGLALYGGIPMVGDAVQEAALRPVAGIEAQILQVREVPAGGSVGYGATFVAPSDMKIGVLNIGYADGYLRLLSEGGYAWAGDRPCRIVGRISMDLLAVEIPQAGIMKRIEISADGKSEKSEVALPAVDAGEGDWLTMNFRLPDLAGALSQYELLTMLGSRFERVWV
ncbi:MAG TPA: alanine racemase [Allosphingosinicella sp.]|jgi:alanine racemase|nr:alanine racemase [Allosphingosinicella sp.]